MRDLLARFPRRTEAYLAVIILVIGILLSALSPAFFSLANAVDLLESSSVTAILAVGVFVVLVAGGIDISFAATASVAQYVTAYMAARQGLPALPAIALGLSVGFVLGCVNAVLIHVLKVVSIIITIATMSVYFALLMYWTGAKSIYDLPDWWTQRWVFFRTMSADGDPIRITLPIVMMVIVALFTWVLMNKTRAGRQLYAMGGNPEAARRLGINIWAMHVLAYGYLGLLAGVAGLLQAHRVQEAVPNAMVGQELNVLAAAVLGGASLMGGIGTVGGVLLGVLLLAILQNGLNLLGVSSYFFQVVIGLVILVSTSITGLSEQRARRRLGPGEARA
jgi:simple sugar transport system permease protein